MLKNAGEAFPIVSWMKKTHLASVLKIDEANNAWEGWSEKDFAKKLREKSVIGMVSEIEGTVVAFAVYELAEKEIFLMKFEVAPELQGHTRAEHVLISEIQQKASSKDRGVRLVLPEARENMWKYKFFAKEGFGSRLKRNFFWQIDEDSNKIYNDGYEFSWKIDEKQVEENEKEEN